MTSISVNQFTNNLSAFVKQVIQQHTPLKITSQDGADFVVISAEVKLVPNYQAISGARKIAQCMRLDQNKSYSFNIFLATIQNLSSSTHERK